MKNLIYFFLILLTTCTISCKKENVSTFTIPASFDAFAQSRTNNIESILATSKNSGGSIIYINSGLKSDENKLKIGGHIADSWHNSTKGTSDEFGIVRIDQIPFNQLTEYGAFKQTDDQETITSMFNGNAHHITLNNYSDDVLLTESDIVFPPNFVTGTLNSDSNGVSLSWTNIDSQMIYALITIPSIGNNRHQGLTETIYVSYEFNDNGNFIIPLDEIAEYAGLFANITLYRVNGNLAEDLRNTDRKNALIITTSLSSDFYIPNP